MSKWVDQKHLGFLAWRVHGCRPLEVENGYLIYACPWYLNWVGASDIKRHSYSSHVKLWVGIGIVNGEKCEYVLGTNNPTATKVDNVFDALWSAFNLDMEDDAIVGVVVVMCAVGNAFDETCLQECSHADPWWFLVLVFNLFDATRWFKVQIP